METVKNEAKCDVAAEISSCFTAKRHFTVAFPSVQPENPISFDIRGVRHFPPDSWCDSHNSTSSPFCTQVKSGSERNERSVFPK